MGNTQQLLGQRIRDLRKSKDLSQEELSYMVGMDLTSINEIENGRRSPLLKTIEKFAKALKVEIRDLF